MTPCACDRNAMVIAGGCEACGHPHTLDNGNCGYHFAIDAPTPLRATKPTVSGPPSMTVIWLVGAVILFLLSAPPIAWFGWFLVVPWLYQNYQKRADR